MSQRKTVILDHDGGVDDLVALALLLANPERIKVIGAIVTDADCLIDYAFDTSGKLMCLMHLQESMELFPIGRSSFKGVNPFPWEWRCTASDMNCLPSINHPSVLELWAKERPKREGLVGEQLLADLVMNSPEKVTICVTGPLSNVAWCVTRYGRAFCDKVEACVVMGGAVDVKGNVFIEGRTDGTAEWNIFWDPPAARVVLTNPDLRSILFSLDSTNYVPIVPKMIQRYGAQNEYVLSQFVGSAWSGCLHVGLIRPEDGYYAWDVLTAAYIVDPSIAEIESVPLDVVVEKNPSEGRTIRSEKSPGNTWIAKNPIAHKFDDLVVLSMRKCPMKH
ncbi:unnamed protein product [Phytomonas sp. EM1]|nr:unnamed protein product [Phytomonas sp. EM1]|eukprot:CCW59764.1 unnamed protein product [Phytomonas sp. isolate EM1]